MKEGRYKALRVAGFRLWEVFRHVLEAADGGVGNAIRGAWSFFLGKEKRDLRVLEMVDGKSIQNHQIVCFKS